MICAILARIIFTINLDDMNTIEADLLVIGGGINGSGIAADAAGRGLKVVLCEAEDLASGTSSWSSKLIHGGLRYLEQYEFKLVREALEERKILLNKLPNMVQPLRFVLPHDKRLRPKWMIRLGLFLYDHIGGRRALEKSRQVKLTGSIYGVPLKDAFTDGFVYSDCRVDDARLVVLNALTAKQHGAKVFTHTPCTHTKREDGHWFATLKPKDGELFQVKSKGIVNAGGPWVSDILHQVIDTNVRADVNLVKGSHFVVPKLYDGDHAYILQNDDKRIIFTIPYIFDDMHHNKYTLIGTTDLEYQGDLRHIHMTDLEIDYLSKITDHYFKKQLNKKEIVWSYAGVRPLFDDHAGNPSKVTREYHLECEDWEGKTPLLSVFGGKITTFRTLSEHALQKLKRFFPEMTGPWTANVKLPGGDVESLEHFYHMLCNDYPFLAKTLAYRYANSYGTLSLHFLQDCQSLADMGQHFGADLYEKEVHYLLEHEWARCAEDIVWRRTKLGIELSKDQIDNLQQWIELQP